MLPGADGMAVLRAAAARPRPPEVLVVTAHGSIDSASRRCARAPSTTSRSRSPRRSSSSCSSAPSSAGACAREVDTLRREAGDRWGGSSIVAASEAMRRVLALVDSVAPTDAPVLLQARAGRQGAGGPGHPLRGPRAGRAFVAINCAALPEALLESELFGHVRGAFTGALAEKRGLFEEADGAPCCSTRSGTCRRPCRRSCCACCRRRGAPGRSHTNRRVDVRAIASTHRDMAALIAEGTFREDLYYRLAVIPHCGAAAAGAPEDILPLVQHFTTTHARRLGKEIRGFAPERSPA